MNLYHLFFKDATFSLCTTHSSSFQLFITLDEKIICLFLVLCQCFQLEGVLLSPGVGIKFKKVILNPVKAFENLENLDHVTTVCLLPSKVVRFSGFSLSSWGILTNLGISLVALLCTFSNLLMPYFSCGDQACAAYSMWGWTSALYRAGRVCSSIQVKHFLILHIMKYAVAAALVP